MDLFCKPLINNNWLSFLVYIMIIEAAWSVVMPKCLQPDGLFSKFWTTSILHGKNLILWFYFVFYTETSDLIVYANLLDQTVLSCQIVTHINMNPTEKFEGVEPVLK